MSRTLLLLTRRPQAVLKCAQIKTTTCRWQVRSRTTRIAQNLKRSTSLSCRRNMSQSKQKQRKMLQSRKWPSRRAQLSRKATDKSEWATAIEEAFSRIRRARATTSSKAPSGHHTSSNPNASTRRHSHLPVPYTSSNQKWALLTENHKRTQLSDRREKGPQPTFTI